MDEETVRSLDVAIAKAPPLEGGFEAFRLADSPLLHAHAPRLVGCECQDLGFLDLTLDEQVARGYVSGQHPVLVRVLAPPGTRAAPLFTLNDNGESEVLLARETRFRVIAVLPPDGDTPLRIDLQIIS